MDALVDRRNLRSDPFCVRTVGLKGLVSEDLPDQLDLTSRWMRTNLPPRQ